jgi:hypothetical protein
VHQNLGLGLRGSVKGRVGADVEQPVGRAVTDRRGNEHDGSHHEKNAADDRAYRRAPTSAVMPMTTRTIRSVVPILRVMTGHPIQHITNSRNQPATAGLVSRVTTTPSGRCAGPGCGV